AHILEQLLHPARPLLATSLLPEPFDRTEREARQPPGFRRAVSPPQILALSLVQVKSHLFRHLAVGGFARKRSAQPGPELGQAGHKHTLDDREESLTRGWRHFSRSSRGG